MQNLVQNFEKYLFENLGILTHFKSWERGRKLPYFLRDLYSLYTCDLLKQPWLVMVSRDDVDITPATIGKHMLQLQKKWDHEVLLLSSSLPTYNRKRLIKHKISFVVPGNQMYLPTLGIDLREHIRRLRTGKSKKFSPSTQVVILAILYDWSNEGVTPSQLAKRLGYTSMTMTRAYDEIEAAGIANVEIKSRKRQLRIDEDKQSFWQRCLEYMRSPVGKRVKILFTNDATKNYNHAGESALSRYSMLTDPPWSVIAMSQNDWKGIQGALELEELPFHEPGTIEVEVWKYPPELFAKDGLVDPLSLYLSLKETKDERVEMALDDLKECYPW